MYIKLSLKVINNGKIWIYMCGKCTFVLLQLSHMVDLMAKIRRMSPGWQIQNRCFNIFKACFPSKCIYFIIVAYNFEIHLHNCHYNSWLVHTSTMLCHAVTGIGCTVFLSVWTSNIIQQPWMAFLAMQI